MLQESENPAAPAAASPAAVTKEMLNAVGSMIGLKDGRLAVTLFEQAKEMQAAWTFGHVGVNQGTATATMLEMKIENVIQAFLAVHMVGVHHAAVASMRKAAVPGQSDESIELHMARAASLMRLYSEQAAMMLKLKGKGGQQTVTVEHVHVEDGGKAVVGTVTAPELDPAECESAKR